jgi:hypothetical protein
MLSKPIIFSDRALLFEANIVLVANELNVSIFNQLWLVRNGVLEEGDFGPGTVISPPAVVIPTPHFQLTFIADRVQVEFTDDLSGADAARIAVEKILQKLPHTPFVALGVNFVLGQGVHGKDSFAAWNQRLFMAPSLAELPLGDRARFGAYFSFDEEGFRAKVDVKPVPAAQFSFLSQTPFANDAEMMVSHVNFHRDLPRETAAQDAIQSLNQWPKLFAKAKSIAESLCPK